MSYSLLLMACAINLSGQTRGAARFDGGLKALFWKATSWTGSYLFLWHLIRQRITQLLWSQWEHTSSLSFPTPLPLPWGRPLLSRPSTRGISLPSNCLLPRYSPCCWLPALPHVPAKKGHLPLWKQWGLPRGFLSACAMCSAWGQGWLSPSPSSQRPAQLKSCK